MKIKQLAFTKTNKILDFYYELTGGHQIITKKYYQNLCLFKKSSLSLGRLSGLYMFDQEVYLNT